MQRLTDRLEEGQGGFGWHMPTEIRDALVAAYLKAHTLKADFDRMEEIPSYLRDSYSALLAVLDGIGKGQKACDNLYSQMRHAFKTTR